MFKWLICLFKGHQWSISDRNFLNICSRCGKTTTSCFIADKWVSKREITAIYPMTKNGMLESLSEELSRDLGDTTCQLTS